MIGAITRIEGVAIRQDAAGRYSLNDLHKAAMLAGKATDSHKPSEFMRYAGYKKFITALQARSDTKAGNPTLTRTVKGGSNPGTYAVELVAMRYAAWIDADFEVGVYLTFQAAAKSRDTWTRERARLAAAHSVMAELLHDTRAEAGKATEAHHYANEAKLVNWAFCGEFKPLDRDSLTDDELALLTFLERSNARLIARGLSYDDRKPMLRQYAMDWQGDRLAIGGRAAA